MEIPLSNGGIALIDDADYPLVKNHRWTRIKSRKSETFYAVTATQKDGVVTRLKMHRVILGLTDPKVFCDHADHNGLNNRRENLRPADPTQSRWNNPKPRTNTSGFKGVSRGQRCVSRPWRAVASAYHRRFYLGYFATPEEDARAFDRFARAHHGPFAYLNFPD